MRILVADDHDLVRETIAAFLRSEGIDDVETAATLDEAIALVERGISFDLILLDYNMPGMSGLTGLDRMREVSGGVPVALLSGTATADIAQAAIRSGAAGFIPKTLPSKTIVSAAQVMAAGEIFAPYSFMTQVPDGKAAELTPREREVLRGLCAGKSNKEIARDLDLQEVTIKLHVKTLSRKLEARNRTHAAMIAKELNLA
ncbi:response regulator [Salipiger mangrovisoli]|uniref:Response regulator transcription factor n=1 Tax=Salipiger mangrovisoli TaxID=2865933 RepID=A0ABR9X647_9RHOB|nr:response regulator transcription factor [Salipiger mangrovisoli]MBE9638999.1 response regulator transcription factor [Salipiger mangrovisoli]